MPSRTRTNLFVTNTMTTARLPTGPPWTRCFAARFAAVTIQARADTRFADTHGVAIVFARSRRTANTFPPSTTKTGAVDAITTTIAILWACSTATKFCHRNRLRIHKYRCRCIRHDRCILAGTSFSSTFHHNIHLRIHNFEYLHYKNHDHNNFSMLHRLP